MWLRGRELDGFDESDRWRVLAKIQAKYLAVLDELDLWDVQTARAFAVEHAECQIDTECVLIGVVELNSVQRDLIDQVADRMTAMVFAPDRLADRFDKYGCLIPGAWQNELCALAPEQIEVVERAGDQADAVVRALAELNGRYSADEITIGVPDDRIVPYIEQRLAECELPARYGAGRPIAESSPCQLLSALADHLDQRDFTTFACLLRHPAIGRWLAQRGIKEDCLTALDEYYSEHLPPRPATAWLDSPWRVSLRNVHQSIEQLIEPLAGPQRKLNDWNDSVQAVLVEVYGIRELDRQVDADRNLLEACEKIQEVLFEISQINSRIALEISGSGALRIILGELGDEAIPPRAHESAIELLGWLELPLDDAPVLAVTGFNEGVVPATLNADQFLPNRLRQSLGLEDDNRRYARDLFFLNHLAASRKALRIIAGRRAVDGQPLVPSRLLLACGDEQLVCRVGCWFAPANECSPHIELLGRLQPSPAVSTLPIPRPSDCQNRLLRCG